MEWSGREVCLLHRRRKESSRARSAVEHQSDYTNTGQQLCFAMIVAQNTSYSDAGGWQWC